MALVLGAVCLNAYAEDRALLIGVGKYQLERANLPGIDLDISMMEQAVRTLGFRSIKTLQNDEATLANVEQALSSWLVEGVGKNDRVLVYYSGHGTSVPDQNGDESDGLDEALTMYDMVISGKNMRNVLVDDRFHALLKNIPSSYVLVLLDACHSATATRTAFGGDGTVAKVFFWEGMEQASELRGFAVAPKAELIADNVVTISAAQDDEQSIATVHGSWFTQGLSYVIQQAQGDAHNLTPTAIRQNVTGFLLNRLTQHLSFHPQVTGNADLLQQSLMMPIPAPLAAPLGTMEQRLSGLFTHAQPLTMALNQQQFKETDKLTVSVTVPQSGYLNIIAVNADDSATVLFPNQYHQDNRVNAGAFSLPTQQMGFDLLAQPPFGRTTVIALLTADILNLYTNGFAQQGKGGQADELFKVLGEEDIQSLTRNFVPVQRQRAGGVMAGRVETVVCAKTGC